jgi:hypothetical protein
MGPDDENNRPDNVHQLYGEEHSRFNLERKKNAAQAFSDVSEDLAQLWDKESLLIRSEFHEKVSDVKEGLGSLLTGAAFIFAGLFAAMLTAVFVLDLFLPIWTSALIVAIAFTCIGAVLMGLAKKKLEFDRIRPKRFMETLEEIGASLKERMDELKH